MASKNLTSPQALTSLWENRKQADRELERGGINTSTSQRIDSFPMTHPQHASTVSHLDHVAAMLLEAISLVEEDFDGLKTNSESVGEDQSQSRQ